jgi:bifunctional DNA-binding transcriptional regulator/antitoxin component of YhaV-PrlF toxin-antitoxin module
MPTTVRVRITAKRQATFPAATLKALGVKPGDYLQLTQEGPSWRLAPSGVDFAKLAPLRDRLPAGRAAFNLAKWRDTPKDHARLRD